MIAAFWHCTSCLLMPSPEKPSSCAFSSLYTKACSEGLIPPAHSTMWMWQARAEKHCQQSASSIEQLCTLHFWGCWFWLPHLLSLANKLICYTPLLQITQTPIIYVSAYSIRLILQGQMGLYSQFPFLMKSLLSFCPRKHLAQWLRMLSCGNRAETWSGEEPEPKHQPFCRHSCVACPRACTCLFVWGAGGVLPSAGCRAGAMKVEGRQCLHPA